MRCSFGIAWWWNRYNCYQRFPWNQRPRWSYACRRTCAAWPTRNWYFFSWTYSLLAVPPLQLSRSSPTGRSLPHHLVASIVTWLCQRRQLMSMLSSQPLPVLVLPWLGRGIKNLKQRTTLAWSATCTMMLWLVLNGLMLWGLNFLLFRITKHGAFFLR
jgi:hypothetical protein